MHPIQLRQFRRTSFLITAFVILGGLLIQSRMALTQYRRTLANHYQYAFAELSIHLSELATGLEKATCAGSPAMVSHLCTQAFAQAQAAQLTLGELPNASVSLESLASFLGTSGDYLASTAWSVAQEDSCSTQVRDTLYTLATTAQQYTAHITSTHTQPFDSLDVLTQLSAPELEYSAEQDIPSAPSTVNEFPPLPTLIYDGPFSEHLEHHLPTMLDGTPSIPSDEARRIASQFVGLDINLFSLVSAGKGALPTFGFVAMVDGGELYIEVTQQGGLICDFFHSRIVGEANILQEDAIQIAQSFLESKGYWGMKATYFTNQGGLLTINFANLQSDVLCYTDLIKVSVALDTGMIAGFEAGGYLANHQLRSFPAVQISTACAQESLSPILTVQGHQMALIPSSGHYERLCHEFKCITPDSRQVLVYINAETGREEQILLLQEDANGTLVL